MNDVIKNLYVLFDVAWEENMNGRGTDITRMVTTFVPDAIQNLQAYEAMFNTMNDNKERPYDHVWDMYLDEFEDAEDEEAMKDKYCLFCNHSMSADAPDGSQVLVCFERDGFEGKEVIVGEDEYCRNYNT